MSQLPDAPPAASRRRAHRPVRSAALVAVVAAAALLMSACLPGDFVKHKAGPYWVWFGPKNYIASYSTYGIDIAGPTGPDAVAHTFDTVVCSSASTLQGSVNAYFPARRAQVASGSGLRNFTILTQTTPTRLAAGTYGANYFRQEITFEGRDVGTNAVVKGEATLDYQLPDTTYCFERLKYRATLKSTFNTSMPRLRAIQDNIIYAGPGACDPEQPDDPCPG